LSTPPIRQQGGSTPAREADRPAGQPSNGARPRITHKALGGLNPDQREAVRHPPGKLLVLAGAGTGKTRVLVRRAAYLIEARAVPPESILAITLTNKAAREMIGRLGGLCGPAAERIHASTFHAMCARILRAHAEFIERTPQFSLYDQDNASQAIKRLLAPAEQALIDHGSVLREISTSKNQSVPLSRYASLAFDDTSRLVARVWADYEEELRRSDALDFDDLLLKTVQLLTRRRDLLAAYQEKWTSVLVDEYQDTNPVQARLLRLLLGESQGTDFMAVGDDRQVIYGFRLANVRLILDFEDEYPGASVITLTRNYRSSQPILDAANRLIAENRRQRSPALFADAKNAKGPPVAVHSSATDQEEASWIAARITRALAQGTPGRDIAVLGRRSNVVDRIEHALAAAGISYQLVIGAKGFFRREEIRAAIAHLRLITNPHDETAFTSALKLRPQVGANTIAKVIAYANRHRLTLIEASMEIDLVLGQISSQARSNIKQFALDILTYTEATRQQSISTLTREVIQMPGGIADSLTRSEQRDSERRLHRLQALCEAASTYERQHDEPTLAGWLADIMLAGRDDLSTEPDSSGRVTLGTIHSIKGLEWPIVIGAGFEGKVIPSHQARSEEDIEEERRMAYVLATRAKRLLILSYALRRDGRTSGPSPFIAEALGDYQSTDASTEHTAA
jgi:DNA helicase-2/ATP-dependent DNA helicase PcrA